jgi:hypothetical protein
MLAHFLDQTAVLTEELFLNSFGKGGKLRRSGKDIAVNLFGFGFFQQRVKNRPKFRCMGPRGEFSALRAGVEVMGIFVNRRIQKQVVAVRPLLKITVVEDNFTALRLVQAVYLAAFFP